VRTAANASGEIEGATRFRMRDLVQLTGLPRATVHYYIQQGLLPEGEKTGRNTAVYGPQHLARLQLIRRLQDEQFLPLKAIRAILDAETDQLDPHKRTVLAEVAARLDADLTRTRPSMVDANDACERHEIPRKDLDRMAALGLVAMRGDEVSSESAWLLEVWGRFRALGFTEELGFEVDDLQMYEESIARLFQEETSLVLARLPQLTPERLAYMLERAMPLVHAVLMHFHTAAVRNFFSGIKER
jgi:DNA-binding transcriptional MerR regulator